MTTSHPYREVHGDIFTSGAEALVNTVNCVGVMGKGIALEFKRRYPAMFRDYRAACARHELSPGTVWVYRAADGHIVFNCAVKDDWRNASKVEWVESCLHELVRLCRSMGVKSLALPWMGAMNGWIPLEQIVAATRRVLSGVTDIQITVYEVRGIPIPPSNPTTAPVQKAPQAVPSTPTVRPRCYLEHVKSCQVCKLVGMEDLCKFGTKAPRINDRALTSQKPPARCKGYNEDFWIKNPEKGMLLSRDRSKFLGYYDPDSVITRIDDAAIAHTAWDMKRGIPVYAWEYRAYKEDPFTPRRIYVGDDANIRESELDHYKDGGYAEDEDSQPELVTPYDAGLDPEEDMPDPENADMHHDGGFVPAFIFRTTHRDRKVLAETPDGRPCYRWETVPTLKPVGCKVDLVDGYVVPRGKYVRLSTIKTRADRKRSRDRAELGRQRRAYTGFLIKKDAVEARIGRPLPELPLRRQVATATC